MLLINCKPARKVQRSVGAENDCMKMSKAQVESSISAEYQVKFEL